MFDHSRVLVSSAKKIARSALGSGVVRTKVGNGCSPAWANELTAAARLSLSGQASPGVPTCGNPQGSGTYLSFPQTSILAGATTTVSLTVRAMLFQGRALKLSKSIAAAFLVTSVKVGNKEMLDIDASNGGFIPGEFFSTENQDCGLIPFCPAPTSQVITLTVKNITAAAVDILAGVEGAAS